MPEMRPTLQTDSPNPSTVVALACGRHFAPPRARLWTQAASRLHGIALLLAGVLVGGVVTFGQPRGAQEQNPRRRERREQQARQQAQRRQAQQRQAQRRQAQTQRDAHQHPPQFFRQLRDLPPDEQERVLANDARFHNLRPERQQQIRDNLRRWNQLTPEQHAAMRQDEDFFQSLPPENRTRVRQELSGPAWQQLTPGRRRAVIGVFRQLRDLPAVDRQKFIENSAAAKSLSPNERDVLARLSGALP